MRVDGDVIGIGSRAEWLEARLFYFAVALSSKGPKCASFVKKEIRIRILMTYNISKIGRSIEGEQLTTESDARALVTYESSK